MIWLESESDSVDAFIDRRLGDQEARRSPATVNQNFSLEHQTRKQSLSDFSVRDWLLVRDDLRDKFVLTI